MTQIYKTELLYTCGIHSPADTPYPTHKLLGSYNITKWLNNFTAFLWSECPKRKLIISRRHSHRTAPLRMIVSLSIADVPIALTWQPTWNNSINPVDWLKLRLCQRMPRRPMVTSKNTHYTSTYMFVVYTNMQNTSLTEPGGDAHNKSQTVAITINLKFMDHRIVWYRTQTQSINANQLYEKWKWFSVKCMPFYSKSILASSDHSAGTCVELQNRSWVFSPWFKWRTQRKIGKQEEPLVDVVDTISPSCRQRRKFCSFHQRKTCYNFELIEIVQLLLIAQNYCYYLLFISFCFCSNQILARISFSITNKCSII